MRESIAAFIMALVVVAAGARAAAVQVQAPSIDKWIYPFAGAIGSGTQPAIQTFGIVGNPDFDNRDGQMFLRFDTTGIAAAGLGASNYQLSSLTLTLTLSSEDTLYDPTYDSYSTYLSGGVDSDAGRPVEVFGVGYRNGATASTWTESSAYGNSGKSARSAYAAGFNGSGQLIDVSNNVDQNFEAAPWAVGFVAGETPGAALESDTEMTFAFNLTDASILAYFQAALHQGFLDLMVTSLYGAVQPDTGPQSDFPVFYAKESLFQDEFVAGRLSGDLTVVPEPGTISLLCLAGLAAWGLRGRRHE